VCHVDVLTCARACVPQELETFNGFWGCFGFRRASARTLLRTMMRSVAREPVSVADFAGIRRHTNTQANAVQQTCRRKTHEHAPLLPRVPCGSHQSLVLQLCVHQPLIAWRCVCENVSPSLSSTSWGVCAARVHGSRYLAQCTPSSAGPVVLGRGPPEHE